MNLQRMNTNSIKTSLALLVVGMANFVTASDWPQWRGPQRNGISQETGLLKEWPADGPKLLWKVSELGRGYAAPSVVGDRIYVLGNEGLENEFVQALSAADGKRLWSTRIGNVGNPKQNPNFPAARSTPTVEEDVLYALGSDGDLVCLQTGDGKLKWRKSLRADFGGKPGEWAYAESPLVDGDVLVCTPGGSDATVVALNKNSGELVWKCAIPEAGEAAYSSPIIVNAAGFKQYVQLVQKGLVGVEAKTGKSLWHYAKPTSAYNANIPTPFADRDRVYAGSAGTGGGAVKLKAKDGGVEAEQLYFNPKLPTAIGSVVKVGDFLYGTTGTTLTCLDFASGEVKWQERAVPAGAACLADNRLYFHTEKGDVVLVEPSPEAYKEKGRVTPPDQPKRLNQMEKAWAYPVVANGKLYIRDHGMLYCYAVK
jgi:outer membrane protein assembly factor BamB